MKKINEGLLLLAAVSSIVFLFIVEFFNNMTLDDIGFSLLLQRENLWKFITEMYFNWQGRFLGFFITGIQMKSYFLFKSMIPFSAVIYVLNIFLVSRSLVNFFKIKTIYSVLYAIVIFQLYVYSMFDISSYFWMCTKGYTFFICLGLFAFSELLVKKRDQWFDYLILFVVFAFLGCSYEIFAPSILLFMGCVLLFKLHLSNYRIGALVLENKKLVYSFAVGTFFFILMVIAPGNLVRMKANSSFSELVFSDFIFTVWKNSVQLLKLLFLKIYYFLAAGSLFLAMSFKHEASSVQTVTRTSLFKRILSYSLIGGGLCLISIILNVFAVGARMELRAFNHINLFCFILIGFSIFELASFGLNKKFTSYALSISLIFVFVCNLFTSFKSIPELQSYKESLQARIDKLEQLRETGNRKTIKLDLLHVAEFHSVDELWKIVIPKIKTRALLKPNEVSNNIDNFYNISYREYYKLDFDVVTDLSFEL